MKYGNYQRMMMLWVLISIFFIGIYLLYLKSLFGQTFFVMLNWINITLFISVLLFKNKIKGNIEALINDIEKVNEEVTNLKVQYRYELGLGIVIVSFVVIVGFYIIFLSLTDVKSYSSLIKEDGLIEYASTVFWLLAAMVLLADIVTKIKRKTTHFFYYLSYTTLMVLFIICAGEEISWGQRLIGISTPEFLTKVNVQNEMTLHNIGSISIFSNAFFLATLVFFLCIPILAGRYVQLNKYLYFYSFPISNRFVIYVFLMSLSIWIIIGIRFGTLGFHPFSFYDQKYYTQMDDEIFEFLAAYSFFAFSLMNRVRDIRFTHRQKA